MANRLLLVRHAQTASRYAGAFIGSSDMPLSALGRRQAAALAARLGLQRPGVIVASPMRRTAQTARAIAKATGARVHFDDDLREIDFGRWEGLRFEQIAAANPAAVDRWAQYRDDFRFPGGERIGSFVQRVARAADRLAALDARDVAVVTHGGVVRTILCCLLGLPPRNYLLFDVAPASLSTLNIFDGKGVLAGLSDTCHLGGIA